MLSVPVGEKHDIAWNLRLNGSRRGTTCVEMFLFIDDVRPKYDATILKLPKSVNDYHSGGSFVEGEGICKGGYSSRRIPVTATSVSIVMEPRNWWCPKPKNNPRLGATTIQIIPNLISHLDSFGTFSQETGLALAHPNPSRTYRAGIKSANPETEDTWDAQHSNDGQRTSPTGQVPDGEVCMGPQGTSLETGRSEL